MFSAIQATLSPDFLAAADDNLRETLQRTASECSLEMVQSAETNLCYVLGWNLVDFLQLEKAVTRLIDLAEAKYSSKSTNTESITRPETCDQATSCRLLQPQFSRAGRELRCKDYDCYDDGFAFANIRSVPPGKSLTAKENVETTGKKRRGRPPKALQKINVNPVLLDDVVTTGEKRLHVEKVTDVSENNLAVTAGTSLLSSDFICSKADEPREQSLALPVAQTTTEEATVTKQESITDEELVASDRTRLDEGDCGRFGVKTGVC